jgi:hypothetical protein
MEKPLYNFTPSVPIKTLAQVRGANLEQDYEKYREPVLTHELQSVNSAGPVSERTSDTACHCSMGCKGLITDPAVQLQASSYPATILAWRSQQEMSLWPHSRPGCARTRGHLALWFQSPLAAATHGEG